ncbi:hypothetical protein BIW11_10795 [Tropilaelaps mercedesae]|uniref:Uncharacterized protein n=1 Tax=Tropilaelaps mercedesae TaxID=418985 RepID=A0A1V9XDX4_9ACAR|nr:hypothetical protein BIW11_10795 [Tropilaelaps mercedesae]
MEALMVSDLKRLCSERGLNPGKLRKQQIIELLKSDGLEDLPTEVVVRDTPRKSILTPSRSRRSTIAAAEGNQPETPRSLRRKTKTEAAELNKENAAGKDSATPQRRGKKTTRGRKRNTGEDASEVEEQSSIFADMTCGGTDEEKSTPEQGRRPSEKRNKVAEKIEPTSDEHSAAEETLQEEGSRRSSRRVSAKNRRSLMETFNLDGGHTDDKQGPSPAKKITPDITDELKKANELANGSKQIVMENMSEKTKQRPTNIRSMATAENAERHEQPGGAENDGENQYATFTTSTDASAEQAPEADEARNDRSDYVTASEEELAKMTDGSSAYDISTRLRRKTWTLNTTEPFNFALDQHPSPGASRRGSFMVEEGDQVERETPPKEQSPHASLTLRENTFVVETPLSARAASKENNEPSRTPFRASKTPNFKKLHEKERARMESIVDHASRKRERMRNLLKTTREIRDRGNRARESTAPLKTPLKTPVNVIKTHVTPSSSTKKIFNDKVRSNRRFDLLMKARGINIDEDFNQADNPDELN